MKAGPRQRYWTEGRADAVVDLVALGYLRNARAEDVARELKIPHAELIAAMRRRHEREVRGWDRPRRIAQPPDVIPDGHKWCPRCSEVKLLVAFGSNRSNADGKQFYCRLCWRDYAQGRRHLTLASCQEG